MTRGLRRQRIVFALVLIFLLPESRILVLRLPFRIASAVIGELVMAFWLAGVLFVLAGLGIITVTRLEQRILIAMAALPCYRYIGRLVRAILLDCAFTGIFITFLAVLLQVNPSSGFRNSTILI